MSAGILGRLRQLENWIALLRAQFEAGDHPTGPAGGDLGGSYPDPTVISVADVISGVLSVANGGTGAIGGLTPHSVLVGDGFLPVTQVGPGALGLPLLGGGPGADPSFGVLPATSVVGVVVEMRFPLGTAATQDSATTLTGVIIIDAEVKVTTPFSPGATLTIGSVGSPALLHGTGDNNLAAPLGPSGSNLYGVHQDTVFAGPSKVRATIGGAPGAGAGFIIVRYVQTPQP